MGFVPLATRKFLPYDLKMQLSGKTVLVTGGASGLGAAAVDMLVAEGARAVIIDLNEEAGRAKQASRPDSVRFVYGVARAPDELERETFRSGGPGGQ